MRECIAHEQRADRKEPGNASTSMYYSVRAHRNVRERHPRERKQDVVCELQRIGVCTWGHVTACVHMHGIIGRAHTIMRAIEKRQAHISGSMEMYAST